LKIEKRKKSGLTKNQNNDILSLLRNGAISPADTEKGTRRDRKIISQYFARNNGNFDLPPAGGLREQVLRHTPRGDVSA